MISTYTAALLADIAILGLGALSVYVILSTGQLSLGNGALMAIGAYSFALTSLNWKTVPLLGVPMNGWWAMVFAAIGGVLFLAEPFTPRLAWASAAILGGVLVALIAGSRRR